MSLKVVREYDTTFDFQQWCKVVGIEAVSKYHVTIYSDGTVLLSPLKKLPEKTFSEQISEINKIFENNFGNVLENKSPQAKQIEVTKTLADYSHVSNTIVSLGSDSESLIQNSLQKVSTGTNNPKLSEPYEKLHAYSEQLSQQTAAYTKLLSERNSQILKQRTPDQKPIDQPSLLIPNQASSQMQMPSPRNQPVASEQSGPVSAQKGDVLYQRNQTTPKTTTIPLKQPVNQHSAAMKLETVQAAQPVRQSVQQPLPIPLPNIQAIQAIDHSIQTQYIPRQTTMHQQSEIHRAPQGSLADSEVRSAEMSYYPSAVNTQNTVPTRINTSVLPIAKRIPSQLIQREQGGVARVQETANNFYMVQPVLQQSNHQTQSGLQQRNLQVDFTPPSSETFAQKVPNIPTGFHQLHQINTAQQQVQRFQAQPLQQEFGQLNQALYAQQQHTQQQIPQPHYSQQQYSHYQQQQAQYQQQQYQQNQVYQQQQMVAQPTPSATVDIESLSLNNQDSTLSTTTKRRVASLKDKFTKNRPGTDTRDSSKSHSNKYSSPIKRNSFDDSSDIEESKGNLLKNFGIKFLKKFSKKNEFEEEF